MKLAFYKGKSLTSQLIKFQSRGVYSHVAFLLENGTVIEAWQDGGVLHNASLGMRHSPGTEVDIFDLPAMETYQKRALMHFLNEQLGKKYDFRGVFRFLSLPRIFNRLDPMADDVTRWFCSELAFAATNHAGIPLLARVRQDKVSPAVLSYSTQLTYVKTVLTGEAAA